MTPLDSTRSSPVAPMRPLRPRCTTGASAAAGGLLVLQALVGRTDAVCTVGVSNNVNMTLSLYSYNGFDDLCTDPYQTASVQGGYETIGALIGRSPCCE